MDATDAPPATKPDPPQDIGEAAMRTVLAELDYTFEDPETQQVKRLIDPPADRASYLAGAEHGARSVIRAVPGGDPTAFALEQLWVHQRFIAEQVVRFGKIVMRLSDKLDEYEKVLPDPDSILARAGQWGKGRRGRGDGR